MPSTILPLLRIAMIAACACLVAPATAQEPPERFEVTPFVGYRMGGDFEDTETGEEYELQDSNAFGITFNIAAEREGQWEFLYARQSTDLETEGVPSLPSNIDMDVEYFHLGGAYIYDGDRTRPFIALTLGVTHFDPDFADVGSENYFSASFGAGVRVKATETLGIRLEGRVYSTLLDSDSNIFCGSNFGVGECLIEVSGSTVNQWEARAGLIFRF